MCIGAPCALAIGMREARLRVPAFAAVIVLNVGVVLSLSRAALVAAPFAQLITFGLDRLQVRRGGRPRPQTPRGGRVALAIAVVAATAIGVSLAAPRVAQNVGATREIELSHPLSNPQSKFYVWNGAGELAMRYPWTGVGRGAFEQAYTQVSFHGGDIRYQWVENGYLEALVDWGAPVALLLAVLAGWALVIALRRLASDPLGCGALGAIVALAVHDAADFSVEVPGIALPALALLATLFARRSSEAEGGRRMVSVRWPYFLAPAACAAVAIVAFGQRLAGDEGRAFAARAARDDIPAQTIVAKGQELVARHPADWIAPLAMGQRLARAGDPEAMRWLNVAVTLNPTHPTPHLVAAELLARYGKKSQALLEYRTAILNTIEPLPIWKRVLARWPATDDLIAATPEDAHKLYTLAYWIRKNQNRPRDAERILDKILTFAPRDVDTLRALAELAIEEGDVAKADGRVRALTAVDGTQAARRLQAEEKLLEKDVAGAAKIADALDRSAETFELQLRIALADEDPNAGLARTDQVAGWATETDEKLRLYEARAALFKRANKPNQYQFEMDRVARLKGP
jgi:hypothetical protein